MKAGQLGVGIALKVEGVMKSASEFRSFDCSTLPASGRHLPGNSQPVHEVVDLYTTRLEVEASQRKQRQTESR